MSPRPSLWYTSRASQDLEDIAQYLESEASASVAVRFLDAADHTLGLLRSTPYIGISCKLRAASLRETRRFPLKAPFNRWTVFYTPSSSEVRIDRFLHSSRNWPVLFR